MLVSLTDAGRRLRASAEGIPEKMLCATQCSIEEIQTLTARLHEMRTTLDNARSED
ncbi:hypothetical protein D3C81_1283630 [compost metagenome]